MRNKSSHGVKLKGIESVAKSFRRHFDILKFPQGKQLLTTYIRIYTDIKSASGSKHAVQVLKEVYQNCVKYSIGLPIERVTTVWLKSRRDNFPKAFNSFRPYLVGNNLIHKRHTLSILRMYECIDLKPEPDLSSVIDESSGSTFYQSFTSDFKDFLNQDKGFTKFLKSRFKKYLEQEIESMHGPNKEEDNFHFTSKRGIEGFSLLTSGKQSLAIKGDLKDSLVRLSKILNKDYYEEVLNISQEFFNTNDDMTPSTETTTVAHGRLSFISSGGGKTRLIAIGNYWIQDILLHIHNILFKILKDIKEDGTYDQSRPAETIKFLTMSKIPITYSYDLTKATDRFPIQPQGDVMLSLNEEIGQLWINILSNLNFYYDGKYYKYAVGQPMGLYSSWAVFALTHHLIVRYAAYKTNKRNYARSFKQYRVLGDDIAIWNKTVAEEYRKIMDGLEVEISIPKSFTPEDCEPSGRNIAEFAKRIFVDGRELTPLPPDLIHDAYTDFTSLCDYIEYLQDRSMLLENYPVSRYSEIRRLSPSNRKILCAMFRVKETLGTQLSANLDGSEEYDLKHISLKSLLLFRMKFLTEQADNVGNYLENPDKYYGYLRSELENLEKQLPKDRTLIVQVYSRLYRATVELRNRFYDILMSSELVFYGAGETRDFFETIMSKVEYIPVPFLDDFKELKPRRQRKERSVYLAKLVRMLTRQQL